MSYSFSNYLPNNSFVHRIHPSLKLIIWIMTLVIILIPNGFTGFIVVGVWIVGLFFLSKLKIKSLFSSFKSCLFLFSILLVINWLVLKGDTDQLFTAEQYGYTSIFSSGVEKQYFNQIYGTPGSFWRISERAIYNSIYVAIKIFYMIIATTILTATTAPLELRYGIEDLIKPLKIFRLPVDEAAMVISICLRFIPTLVDESQKIIKAQASRGVDFKNGSIKDKTRSMISLIIPLFSIAFQKAEGLSDAMEARAYNTRQSRTRYREFKIRWIDYLVIFLITSYLTFCIMWKVFNFFFAPFGNPEALVLMYQPKPETIQTVASLINL
jgi:energy-coupling factor transport system permease protein